MNRNPQVNGTSHGAGASAAMGFVLGALAGAAIALLLSPGSGKENRQRLTDAGRRWGRSARNKFDQARETAHDLTQDVRSAVDAGREAFEHGQKSHEPRPASRTELTG